MARKKLSAAHIRQLLLYMNDRDLSGWYYGNRKQFEKRHDYLRKYLEAILATKEGIA